MSGTYSFLDVHCALVGPGVALDLGAGAGAAEEGISIEPTEDVNQMMIGADGSAMHSLRANQSGTLAVRLLKTSPLNAALQLAYNVQTTSGALHGKNTIVVTNTATGDAITCNKVAFARRPVITYAKDANMNEWRFHAGRLDGLLGAGA